MVGGFIHSPFSLIYKWTLWSHSVKKLLLKEIKNIIEVKVYTGANKAQVFSSSISINIQRKCQDTPIRQDTNSKLETLFSKGKFSISMQKVWPLLNLNFHQDKITHLPIRSYRFEWGKTIFSICFWIYNFEGWELYYIFSRTSYSIYCGFMSIIVNYSWTWTLGTWQGMYILECLMQSLGNFKITYNY